MSTYIFSVDSLVGAEARLVLSLIKCAHNILVGELFSFFFGLTLPDFMLAFITCSEV